MKQAFLFVFLSCSAIIALGQSPTHEVSFQATTQTVEGSTLHLKGKVKIGNAQSTVQADEVDFNVDTSEIEARGNVRITSSVNGVIQGERISGNLRADKRWLVITGPTKTN
jgi:lipopolysaccharide assembly outer membrane protein LptD (OstA)